MGSVGVWTGVLCVHIYIMVEGVRMQLCVCLWFEVEEEGDKCVVY